MRNSMDTVWSSQIQGVKTLYYSRKLRFDDAFAQQYKALFNLDEHKKLKILEIGCGPGALAGALHRWFPNAEITAIDRDKEFIRFAKEHEQGITFMEADATSLPFANESFDVTISNTVSEHIEPSAFYGEQRRVLKNNGVCIVLSSRKGICVTAPCLAESEAEQAFWTKAAKFDDSFEKFSIGKYAVNEAELPLSMEKQGFSSLSTGFVCIPLTPDNLNCSKTMALAIIEAEKYGALESVESVLSSMPKHFTNAEVEEMKEIVCKKFDNRIRDYFAGKKYWDTSLSVIMIARGVK